MGSSVGVGAGVGIALGIVILFIVGPGTYYYRKRRKNRATSADPNKDEEMSMRPKSEIDGTPKTNQQWRRSELPADDSTPVGSGVVSGLGVEDISDVVEVDGRPVRPVSEADSSPEHPRAELHQEHLAELQARTGVASPSSEGDPVPTNRNASPPNLPELPERSTSDRATAQI